MDRRQFLSHSAIMAGSGTAFGWATCESSHAAAQLLPVRYKPTHFASPTGAGSHNGNRGNEWNLAEAYSNAAAGNCVQFAPGVYVARSGKVRTQASTPRNNGTSSEPIVFFAEYPAIYHQSQPELHSTWVTDGRIQGTGSVTGHADQAAGGHYVVWDGISMRQVNGAWNSGELSVISLFGGGDLHVKFLRCLFDQKGHGQMEPAFNWGAVFIQQTSSIEFADCVFQNIPGSHGDENAMPFVTYAAGKLDVHHCEFRNNNGGSVFVKGVQAGSAYDNRPIRWRNCLHVGYTSLGLAFGAVGDTNVQDGQFCDFVQNLWQPASGGVGISVWWRDVSRGGAPRNVRLVNNTFVGSIPFSGGEEAFHRVMTITEADNIWRDSMFINNIIQYTGTNIAYIGIQYGATTPAAFKKFRSDCNCFSSEFRSYGGMDWAGWKRLGQDVGTLVGNPRLRDPRGGDFRLDANSPVRATGTNPGVDVLNLQKAGSSAKINRGAYITSDMSDAIGVRPRAVTDALQLVWNWPYV